MTGFATRLVVVHAALTVLAGCSTGSEVADRRVESLLPRPLSDPAPCADRLSFPADVAVLIDTRDGGRRVIELALDGPCIVRDVGAVDSDAIRLFVDGHSVTVVEPSVNIPVPNRPHTGTARCNVSNLLTLSGAANSVQGWIVDNSGPLTVHIACPSPISLKLGLGQFAIDVAADRLLDVRWSPDETYVAALTSSSGESATATTLRILPSEYGNILTDRDVRTLTIDQQLSGDMLRWVADDLLNVCGRNECILVGIPESGDLSSTDGLTGAGVVDRDDRGELVLDEGTLLLREPGAGVRPIMDGVVDAVFLPPMPALDAEPPSDRLLVISAEQDAIGTFHGLASIVSARSFQTLESFDVDVPAEHIGLLEGGSTALLSAGPPRLDGRSPDCTARPIVLLDLDAGDSEQWVRNGHSALLNPTEDLVAWVRLGDCPTTGYDGPPSTLVVSTVDGVVRAELPMPSPVLDLAWTEAGDAVEVCLPSIAGAGAGCDVRWYDVSSLSELEIADGRPLVALPGDPSSVVLDDRDGWTLLRSTDLTTGQSTMWIRSPSGRRFDVAVPALAAVWLP